MPHSGPELLTRPAAPAIAPVRIPDADADVGVCTAPLQPFAAKMSRAGMPSPLVALFASYLEELACGSTGLIPESDILPVGRDDLPLLDDLAPYAATGRARLREAACIKLNGGLGTSMGMTHAKSLLPAKNGATFLELIVRQAEHLRRAHGGPSPLLFMNSFSTHQDTLRALDVLGLQHTGRPGAFLQHRFPKVSRATLLPVEYPENPELEWNPPGHGDIYAALALSGHLDRLLESGRRYALISNADNLGATLDPAILGYLMEEDIPFLMECAPRTPADRKGGHLARSRDGGLALRELAQCPDEDLPRFQDIVRYGLFNTNNIWLDLRALRRHIDGHGLLRLPMIRNPKTVNPRDPHSEKVWQVETAMGAAISLFPKARAAGTRRPRAPQPGLHHLQRAGGPGQRPLRHLGPVDGPFSPRRAIPAALRHAGRARRRAVRPQRRRARAGGGAQPLVHAGLHSPRRGAGRRREPVGAPAGAATAVRFHPIPPNSVRFRPVQPPSPAACAPRHARVMPASCPCHAHVMSGRVTTRGHF